MSPSYGSPSAALWKDQLFVAVSVKMGAYDVLFRGPFAPDTPKVRAPVEYCCPPNAWMSRQAKLDIREDWLLLAATGKDPRVVPMTDVPLLELSEFGATLRRARGYEDISWFVNGPVIGDSHLLLFPQHRMPDVPAPLTRVNPSTARSPEQTQRQREEDYVSVARFDVQLAGPKKVRLFHAHKDTLFVSIELDYQADWYRDLNTWEVKKGSPKPPARKLRTGKLPPDFPTYFTAYTADKHDYLVAEDGRVYSVTAKGEEGLDVSAVWSDPLRKVLGVIQDQSNEAVYGWGFVTWRFAPERFYVKFAPKPIAVPYKRTVPLWGDRSDAYLESYECARAFRKDTEKK